MKNGRCRVHGGPSTGPKRPNTRLNAVKTGIYAKNLLPGELALYRSMQLGNVDHEIRLTRLRLNRALAAEAEAGGGAELDEIITRELVGPGSKRDERLRVRDYAAIIDRLTVRIESLERTRSELLKRGEGDDPDSDEGAPIGKIILEVVGAKPSHDHDRAAG